MFVQVAMGLCLASGVIALATATQAATLFEADFTASVSIDHTTTGNLLEPSTQAGANFVIGYTASPLSDTTRNFFETDGDSLVSSDFGGDHFMRTSTIDVSGWDSIDISVTASFIGTDVFNNQPTEFLDYIYLLDGGAETTFFSFSGTPNAADLNAMTSVNVSGFGSLIVGLNANVNGAGDGFDMTALTVEGTQASAVVPLPAGLPLLISGGVALGVLRSRRRG